MNLTPKQLLSAPYPTCGVLHVGSLPEGVVCCIQVPRAQHRMQTGSLRRKGYTRAACARVRIASQDSVKLC